MTTMAAAIKDALRAAGELPLTLDETKLTVAQLVRALDAKSVHLMVDGEPEVMATASHLLPREYKAACEAVRNGEWAFVDDGDVLQIHLEEIPE